MMALKPTSGATAAGVRNKHSWPLLPVQSAGRAYLIEQLAFTCQHEGDLVCASVAMHLLIQDVCMQVQEQDVFEDICMSLPTSIVTH